MADILMVWGFVLTFTVLMGAGIYEACKIVAVIPAAFESSPANWRNPLRSPDDEYGANQNGRRKLTPRERAQERQRAAQQER